MQGLCQVGKLSAVSAQLSAHKEDLFSHRQAQTCADVLEMPAMRASPCVRAVIARHSLKEKLRSRIFPLKDPLSHFKQQHSIRLRK